MTLTYAGVNLLVPTPDIQEWIDTNIDMRDLYQTAIGYWAGQQPTQHLRWEIPTHPITLNSLYWPMTGFGWGWGDFLVDGVRLTAIRLATSTWGSFPLVMSDGTNTISTNLYMLPARPLTQISGKNGLYLLTLVDQRYFWHVRNISTIAITEGTTTWTTVLGSLGFSPDSFSYDTPPVAYLKPSNFFNIPHLSVAEVSQRVSAALGMRVLRNLSGAVEMRGATTSLSRFTSNVTTFDSQRIAGGSFQDPNLLVPSLVNVSFPLLTGGTVSKTASVTYGVSLTSLALPQFSGVTGYDPMMSNGLLKLLRSTTIANGASPTNDVELQALATQMATDWYLHALGTQDASYAGLIPWTMEGVSGAIQWNYVPGKCTSRIWRGWWPKEDTYDNISYGSYGSIEYPSDTYNTGGVTVSGSTTTNTYPLFTSPGVIGSGTLIQVGITPTFPAGTTGGASLNIPDGTAPTSPNNGDIWQTTDGLFKYHDGTPTQIPLLTGGYNNAGYVLTSTGLGGFPTFQASTGLSGLTTNRILRATSSTTAGDSSIDDDGTTVTLQQAVGSGDPRAVVMPYTPTAGPPVNPWTPGQVGVMDEQLFYCPSSLGVVAVLPDGGNYAIGIAPVPVVSGDPVTFLGVPFTGSTGPPTSAPAGGDCTIGAWGENSGAATFWFSAGNTGTAADWVQVLTTNDITTIIDTGLPDNSNIAYTDVVNTFSAIQNIITSTAVTNAVTPQPLTITVNSTGTTTAGFGQTILLRGKVATTTNKNFASLTTGLVSAVSGSNYSTYLALSCSASGVAKEGIRIAFATTVQLGFYGTAPVVKPADLSGLAATGLVTSSTLPVTDITGCGTGVIPALGVAVGSSGAVVVNGGALGTPSSGNLSSCTGYPLTSVVGAPTGLYARASDVANATTGADENLLQDTIPANSFVNTLDRVEGEVVLTSAASATATSEFKLVLDGHTLFDSGALTINITSPLVVMSYVFWKSSTSGTVRYVVKFQYGPTVVDPVVGDQGSLTFTSSMVVKVVTNRSALGSAGDIVAKTDKGTLYPSGS